MIKGCEKPQLLIVLDMMGNTRKVFVPFSKYLAKSVKANEHLCFITYEQDMGKSRRNGRSFLCPQKETF